MARVRAVSGRRRVALDAGWTAQATPAGAVLDPAALARIAAPGAAAALDAVAAGAKTLLFKTARAVTARRPFDVAPATAPMATAWEAALGALDAAVAGSG